MLRRIEEKDIKPIATRATRQIWKAIERYAFASTAGGGLNQQHIIALQTEIEQIIIESIQNERYSSEVF